MKTNHPHQWLITLRGKTRTKTVRFIGTLDAALAEADEQESAVAFVVIEFVVTRGALNKLSAHTQNRWNSPVESESGNASGKCVCADSLALATS